MATWTGAVGASADDARNINGATSKNITAQTQHLGKFNATDDYWNGFRWTNVTVPQGATITSATVDLYSAQVTAGTTAKSIWYGVNEDNTATFDTSTSYPEGKTITSASVTKDFTCSTWSATLGYGVELVTITTLVQEIVNRAGWASGNAMGIVAHDNGSTSTNYIGHSTYDRATNRGATLTINYTTVTPPTAPTSLTATQTGQNIVLSWTDNSSNEDGFTVERKRGGSSNYYSIGSTGASVATLVDRYVDPGYTYTYRVKATSVTLGDSTYATSSSIAASGTKRWTAQPMSWHYPSSVANPLTEYSARKNWGLKPEYYTVNGSGVVGQVVASGPDPYGYSSTNVTNVKTHGRQNFVTVSCGVYANFSALMASSTNKSNAITDLTNFCITTGLQGIELDFEKYSSWNSTEYGQYKTWVTSLGTSLHAVGKKLMVDGPPITNSTEQAFYLFKYEDFYSIPQVDYMCMMLYDYQWDYDQPNSVQPAAWAQNGCKWMRDRLQVNRVVIGMPKYGYHATIAVPYSISIDTKQVSTTYTGYGTATANSDGMMNWTNGGVFYGYYDSTGLNTMRERIEDEGIKFVSSWHDGGNDSFTGKLEPSQPNALLASM